MLAVLILGRTGISNPPHSFSNSAALNKSGDVGVAAALFDVLFHTCGRKSHLNINI